MGFINKIMKVFIFFFLAFNSFAQYEVYYPQLQRTFEFYLQDAGAQHHLFELHFYRPNTYLFPQSESWGEDGFGVRCHNRTIELYATSDQGFQNALYDLLQRKFGFEYYQADVVHYPTSIPKKFQSDCYDSKPAFAYREIFYGETRRSGFANWHKLTSGESTYTFENHPGWGLWVHTLHRLLPPSEYFESHPEYYALRNGIRLADQVCLSKPEVLEIVCNNLAKEISKNPKAKYWSVSQMDNYNYCQCMQCTHTDSIEHSHAGTMLRFVNEVAKRFPNQVISTLAYQYTRTAPILTKAEPNVNIMLCTIEEDRAKSLRGTSFEKDLKAWSALTQQILIWDYVINFSHLVMPFPNWPTLQENLLLFKEYGVQMLFEQGYNSPSSEMQPLRAFLLSKWSWDPTIDANLLIRNFLDAYYGPAAGIVREILEAQVQGLQLSGKSLTLYEPPITHLGGYLNPSDLNWALLMYEKAKGLEGMSSEQIRRIEMCEQSIRYALLEICKSPLSGKAWYFNDNQEHYQKMLKDFVWCATQYGPKLLHETKLSPQEYYLATLQFWKTASTNHLAKNQKIRYINLPAPSYNDGLQLNDTTSWTQNSSLIDGLHSTEVYQKGWQAWQGEDAKFEITLDTAYLIDSIKITYLANNQSWIMGPSIIEAKGLTSLSNHFETSVSNVQVNQPQANGTYPLILVNFAKEPIQTLSLTVGNPGNLPQWRGVDGKGWLFIDEIEIYGHE